MSHQTVLRILNFGGKSWFLKFAQKKFKTLSALFTYASGLSLISGCCGEASLFTPCGYHLPLVVGPFLFFPLEVVTLVAAVVVTFRCFVTKAKPTFPISCSRNLWRSWTGRRSSFARPKKSWSRFMTTSSRRSRRRLSWKTRSTCAGEDSLSLSISLFLKHLHTCAHTHTHFLSFSVSLFRFVPLIPFVSLSRSYFLSLFGSSFLAHFSFFTFLTVFLLSVSLFLSLSQYSTDRLPLQKKQYYYLSGF